MDELSAASIVDSTIGAGLLELLEQTALQGGFPDVRHAAPLATSTPATVARGAECAAELSFGELVKLAVLAHDCTGSYWGHETSVHTLRLRQQRAPIAEALAARPDRARWLAAAADEQWWWTDGTDAPTAALGSDLEQLAWWWSTQPAHGLPTTSPFPAEMLATGIEAPLDLVWDICMGPRARWRLTIAPNARIYQVDSPANWEALVRTYPHEAGAAYPNGREISSVNDNNDRAGLAAVLAVDGQRAVRRGWRRFLNPNWAELAHDWDGVHLSWARYVLTDGTVIDLDDGDITMLRNWGSVRTIWLAPVLRDPGPLPIPVEVHESARSPHDPAWEREREALSLFACGIEPSD